MKLSEEELQKLCIDTKHFVVEELEPLGKIMDETNTLPPSLVSKLAQHRLMGLRLPERYGGMGLSFSQYWPILTAAAQGAGGIREIVDVHNAFTWYLERYASEEQKMRYLPECARGERILAFALTEPNSGSGADIQTKAVRDGDVYVVNGEKHFITWADIGNPIITVVRTGEGGRDALSILLIEQGTPGMEIETMAEPMGIRGIFEGVIRFQDAVVPAANLLGQQGKGLEMALGVLAIGRAGIAVCCLGMAERFLELSIEYAKQRVTFGLPIIRRQAVQQMLADMATAIFALRSMVSEFGHRYDNGAKIAMEADMCKLFGMSMIRDVSDKALEIHGGRGYMKDNPIERLYRDSRVTWLEEGTPTLVRFDIFRNLVPEYRSIEA